MECLFGLYAVSQIDKGGECLYLDFKLAATEFGYLRRGATDWTNVNTESWNDTSWIGEESTRRAIAAEIYASTPTPPNEP